MQFTKLEKMFRVSRITGTQDNILGIVFSENKNETINVIEWKTKKGATIKTTAPQVLEQVEFGLKKANEELGKNYQLSEIHFLPSESASNSVYEFLIQALVQRYDSDGEFRDLKS